MAAGSTVNAVSPTIEVLYAGRIVQGFGIALKSIWDIEHHLASGELVRLLTHYAPLPSFLQIVHLGGQAMPRRLRMLIDHLAQHLTPNSLNRPEL